MRRSGLKMVLDARDCAPSGWSGAKLLWTCILLISPGFIRRKKKKLLLKHALSKTHKPSIHRPYIPENPISAKENYSSAHFMPERKSSVVTLITKSGVGSERSPTRVIDRISHNIYKQYRLEITSGIADTYPTRLPMLNTWQ